MKLQQLNEARPMRGNKHILQGWFVYNDHRTPIKIELDCSDSCRVIDWEGNGTTLHHFRDVIKPGTQVRFKQGTYAWYISPMYDAEVVGWFIRGPEKSSNLYQDADEYTAMEIDEARTFQHNWGDRVIDLFNSTTGWSKSNDGLSATKDLDLTEEYAEQALKDITTKFGKPHTVENWVFSNSGKRYMWTIDNKRSIDLIVDKSWSCLVLDKDI